ncbi:MAG: peptidase M28, partial [Gemmatimonadota bacterium]|nr:peptidase M28 [Gemmatimonadota bacterium]
MLRSFCPLLLATALFGAPQSLTAQQPAEAWWRHVQVLAHDSLRGRDTGSPGHEAAARYVADQFRLAGLTPAGTDGWMQPVRFIEMGIAREGVAVSLREGGSWTPLALGRDIRLTARLSTADVEAPLVFAGYGVSLPQAGMDDLAGLDLRGKIVVYVNAKPAGLSAPLLAHGTRTRWAAMRQAG